MRQVPIPPPSHPRQYRAIGLIEGQYQASVDHINRGVLVTSQGSLIEAVLLGRMMSVIKNHVDLEKSHLWVVYPRTRRSNDRLHLQIVGIWEPETLAQNSSSQTKNTSIEAPLTPPIEDGYFSIRGEAIFVSCERETVIFKIRQSGKQRSEKSKFFQIKLKGKLPNNSVGHFWDLQVQLEKNILVIQTATDLGLIPPRKKLISKFSKDKGKKLSKHRTKKTSSKLDYPSFPRKLSLKSQSLPKPITKNQAQDK
ncbi:MAG TPA: hypothetical protein DCF68_13920 [Cyanothece sp. UBA12306]|nr:hypothetical protein [Cyanothece sp. UBA12306]